MNVTTKFRIGQLLLLALCIVGIVEAYPVIDYVSISPPIVYSTITVSCIGIYHDSDGPKELDSIYNWYINDLQLDSHKKVLYIDKAFINSSIFCEYVPSNGIINGNAINSSKYNILEYPQLITNISRNMTVLNNTSTPMACTNNGVWDGTKCSVNETLIQEQKDKNATNASKWIIISLVGLFITFLIFFKNR